MNKKGISIVSLSVTIVILLVIASTISVSITYSISNAKKLTFAKEIYNIQNLVTEYIQKENVLPVVTSTIQIEPSDTEQFEGESITDGKLLLSILDLTELDVVNTNYGNKKIGESDSEKEKDIYAVSANTGRVYYIAGFKDNGKTYYTLTDDLLNMIEKKQDLLIGEKTIIFTPSKLGWSNEAISVKVTVPSEYEVTNFTINNENILYTEETADNIKSYIVNADNVFENYEVAISYTKNGTQGNIKYKTKIDATKPVITKNENVNNTDSAIKGLNATDEESGIKQFKYVEGIINDVNAKDYIISYGKNINKGSIKMKTKSVYTLYAEDKAGNYTVLHLDGDGERFYPTIATATGKNELTLTNSYNLGLINYTIYGNSVQNGAPTVNTPVEIQSVGEKTSNLLNANTVTSSVFDIKHQTDGSITISGSDTSAQNIIYIEDTVENAGFKAGVDYTIHHESSISSLSGVNIGIYNVTTGAAVVSSTTSGKTFKFDNTTDKIRIRINVAANTVLDDYNVKLQIEEGTTATEYEPYGKYKIPVTVRGKNLAHPNGRNFTVNGITLTTNEDGTVTLTGKATESVSTILTWSGRNKDNVYYNDFILYPGETVRTSIINTETGEKATFSIGLQWVGVETGKTYYGNINVDEPVYFNRIYTHKDLVAGENIYEGTWKLQLEKGSSYTSYEPYIKPSITNIYLDEPLRKIGNYIDYIDFKENKIVRKIEELVLDGNSHPEKGVYYSKNSYFTNANGYAITLNDYLKNSTQGLSNYFIQEKTSSTLTSGIVFGQNINMVTSTEMNLSTVDEFKAWITDLYENNNPVKIYYILNDESTEKIKLPEFKLNYGTNIVSIGTTIAPSQTDITYYKKQ